MGGPSNQLSTHAWRSSLVLCGMGLVLLICCASTGAAVNENPTGMNEESGTLSGTSSGLPQGTETCRPPILAEEQPEGKSSDAESRAVDPKQPIIHGKYIFSSHPEPGIITLRVSYDLPDTVSRFNVNYGSTDTELAIRQQAGFVQTGNTSLDWKRGVSNTTNPYVVFRYTVNQSAALFPGYNFVDTNQWTLLEHPELTYQWRYENNAPIYRWSTSVPKSQNGFAAGTMVYLGNYTRYQYALQENNLTIVSPTSTQVDTSSQIAQTFTFADRSLDVGGGSNDVVLFLLSSPIRDGGWAVSPSGATNDSTIDSMWVSLWETPNDPIFYSEFIHLRQNYTTTPRMGWLTEAQDGYWSLLLALNRGTVSYTRFYSRIISEADRSPLAPEYRDQYRQRRDYTKGRLFLAALDGKIRQATNHERSLLDVWRELNRHPDEITLEDYKKIVNRVAGRSFDAWIEQWLTSRGAPDLPDDPNLYILPSQSLDTDSDGLENRAERLNNTNPFVADTDGDGISDGQEVESDRDPTRPDTANTGTTVGSDQDPTTTNGKMKTNTSTDSPQQPLRYIWYIISAIVVVMVIKKIRD